MKEKTDLIKADEMFKDKTSVKKLENLDDMFVFRCSDCGGVHFRHAGYMEMLIPWMDSNKKKKINRNSLQVQVCVKCKKSYIYLNDNFYDVSNYIDVKAWEKAEKKLHKATGPGGQC